MLQTMTWGNILSGPITLKCPRVAETPHMVVSSHIWDPETNQPLCSGPLPCCCVGYNLLIQYLNWDYLNPNTTCSILPQGCILPNKLARVQLNIFVKKRKEKKCSISKDLLFLMQHLVMLWSEVQSTFHHIWGHNFEMPERLHLQILGYITHCSWPRFSCCRWNHWHIITADTDHHLGILHF